MTRAPRETHAGGSTGGDGALVPFEPLHFADRLTVVSPLGTIGIVTLWSRVDYVLGRLRQGGVDLDPSTSPIAVLGTLYGNGLRELLRNLLHNPQIDTLVFFGRDRSGSAHELEAFFTAGIEPHEAQFVVYEAPPGREAPQSMRIRGTSRIIDSLVRPEDFERAPRFFRAGSPQDPSSIENLKDFLAGYAPSRRPMPERRRVPLPGVTVSSYPSNPRQHTICASDVLSAWRELIFRLHRFGLSVRLAKGERRELQGVKVVVEDPAPVADEDLGGLGLSKERLARYQEEMLSGKLLEDETYSYGHRMRSYFDLDSLDAAVGRLKSDPEDRKSYVALWDPRRDMEAPTGHPCLVSLFFRRFQGRLTLTAVFRTHNALDAWLVNFHGLTAIQSYAAERCGMSAGAITVFSHSISLDVLQMDRAALIASTSGFQYREDPMGYFRISVSGGLIHVEHRFGDDTLKVYRHAKASHIQQELYRDCAVSDISHAIYLGRQLAKAELCLRGGEAFVQE